MKKKYLRFTLLVWVLCAVAVAQQPPLAQTAPSRPAPRKPKLVLALLIDQFRYDYLTRFRQDYHGGLARMLDRGAVFTNANYIHFPTVTAIGHSTYLTGATPSMSGIVGNEWYDRELGKKIESVTDSSVKLLGTDSGLGASPRNLLVSTVADELKMSGRGKTKAIGISIKDRAAILPVGHMADAAYWFDENTGNFITSTYYMQDLPGWVKDFNNTREADKLAGQSWFSLDDEGKKDAKAYRTMPTRLDKALYGTVKRTPWGNELLVKLAERAIEAEQLGRGDGTDLLSVSFSSNDYVGHALGPDAPEVRDISVRTDRMLGKFFDFIDTKIGLNNVVVVLTADHGVSPMPEVNQKRRMPGGRNQEGLVPKIVADALTKKYGAGTWVLGSSGPAPYLNHTLIQEKKLSLEEVRQYAAEVARAVPHVARVYTASDVRNNRLPGDQVDQRLRVSYHERRASDLFVVSDPYWVFEDTDASHGSPYSFDSHVPIVFMGPWIKGGVYHTKVIVNDIAPTLATLLEVETPSGSVGRVLDEILVRPAIARPAAPAGR
jgi:predicted AlkP superfamily pyrophosphatase or phosphodiesterase